MLAAGVLSLVGLAAAQPPSTVDAATELLEQLDARAFADREAAERSLRGATDAAADAILDYRAKSAESAARLRRLRPVLRRRKFEALAAAATEGDGGAARQVPGIDRFATRLSPAAFNRLAAAVATRLARSTGDLTTPQQRFEAALRAEVVDGDYGVDLAALAALASHPEVKLSVEDVIVLNSGWDSASLRRAARDEATGPLVRLTLGSMLANFPPELQAMALMDCAALDVDGLEDVCVSILNAGGEPDSIATALAVLSRSRSTSVLSLFEDRMSDRTVIYRTYKDEFGSVRVSDVALAGALLIIGEDPRKLGFDRLRIDDRTGFRPGTAAPRDDDARRAAGEHYRDVVARRVPDVQPPPVRAVVGERL